MAYSDNNKNRNVDPFMIAFNKGKNEKLYSLKCSLFGRKNANIIRPLMPKVKIHTNGL
jgi:hypothetical protein